jgi:hypothetical protein
MEHRKSYFRGSATAVRKPNCDEATWGAAVVTVKRDKLALDSLLSDSLSSLNIHHQDLIPTARASLFIRDSSGVVPSKSKSVATDRRRAKWNCTHLFLLFRFLWNFRLVRKFERLSKNSDEFVQTLVQSMRLDELQLSHRPVVIGVKSRGLRSRRRHAICSCRRAIETRTFVVTLMKNRSKRGNH